MFSIVVNGTNIGYLFITHKHTLAKNVRTRMRCLFGKGLKAMKNVVDDFSEISDEMGKNP